MSFSIEASLKTCFNAQAELIKPDPQLERAVTNSQKNGLRPIAIGPAQGQLLSTLCQLTNAKTILEIGVLGGYSTIWLAKSVPGVKVIGIEYDAKHRDVAVENLKGLDNVEIILGAALDVLPKLEKEGHVFDLVFIDADWENQHNYFDWAVKLTRPKSIIYVDNALRWLTEGEAEGDADARKLIEHVKKSDKVDATFIPMLNTEKPNLSEAVDGFVLAIVK